MQYLILDQLLYYREKINYKGYFGIIEMTGVQITEQMKYCVNVKITKVNDTVL
jgi:hypothetical protein